MAQHWWQGQPTRKTAAIKCSFRLSSFFVRAGLPAMCESQVRAYLHQRADQQAAGAQQVSQVFQQ